MSFQSGMFKQFYTIINTLKLCIKVDKFWVELKWEMSQTYSQLDKSSIRTTKCNVLIGWRKRPFKTPSCLLSRNLAIKNILGNFIWAKTGNVQSDLKPGSETIVL